MSRHTPAPPHANACLLFSNGDIYWGRGIGAEGEFIGEICFNTGLSGYQETLTDPSYCDQIITFTFPHIGNVGTNETDRECNVIHAAGCIVRNDVTSPSNWRSEHPLETFLSEHGKVGISGLDTRAITRRIRSEGAENVMIAYNKNSGFDVPALLERLKSAPSMTGRDLAKKVSCTAPYEWTEGTLGLNGEEIKASDLDHHVVVLDYGVKCNILHMLVDQGARLTVMPCDTDAKTILDLNPDGIFLSNGPGDPEATGEYAVPVIQELLKSGTPLFGICLGHQLLARALGCTTHKMERGHRGANQPVQELATKRVEITSQNHGFVVDRDSLPDDVEETHVSLFDGTNEGIRSKKYPAFSVQYHPEASPGPHDAAYLFEAFRSMIIDKTQEKAA